MVLLSSDAMFSKMVEWYFSQWGRTEWANSFIFTKCQVYKGIKKWMKHSTYSQNLKGRDRNKQVIIIYCVWQDRVPYRLNNQEWLLTQIFRIRLCLRSIRLKDKCVDDLLTNNSGSIASIFSIVIRIYRVLKLKWWNYFKTILVKLGFRFVCSDF